MSDPKQGEIWVYKKTGNEYYIEGVCEIKSSPQGSWVEGVAYSTGTKLYARDMETFIQRFEKVKETK